MNYRTKYLTWVNCFLSVDGFAAYYGYGYREATRVINKGRILHESQMGSILPFIGV